MESTIVSKLHSEVSAVMSSLNVPHDIERITEDGLFSADILIEDVKVIVEVDGPHHFTVNTHQPLGMFTFPGTVMQLSIHDIHHATTIQSVLASLHLTNGVLLWVMQCMDGIVATVLV